MAAYDSEIVIVELTGRKRSVVLRGGGLPFQGAQYGGAQRLVTTFYPGNVEATQSVLGPIETPSSWQGMWRTTMLSRTPAKVDINGDGNIVDVSRADVLRDCLEQIFREGQLLRVTWHNKIGDRPESVITRHGRAADWKFPHDRADDIGWDITFDWVSRGVAQQKVARLRGESSQPDLEALGLVTEQLARDFTDMHYAYDVKAPKAAQFTLDSLMNLVNAPLDVVKGFAQTCTLISNRIGKIGDLINAVRNLPTQLLGQLLSIANTAVSTANNFVDKMSQKSPEAMVTSNRASQLAMAVSYYGDAMTQADLMRSKGLALRALVENAAEAQSTILAVYIAKGIIEQGGKNGELLSAISMRFYNSADLTASIAKANRLPLNQQFILRGTVLIIPTLSATRDFTASGG